MSEKRIRARASLFIALSLFRIDNWQDLYHETHVIKSSSQSANGVQVPVSHRYIPAEWHQHPPASHQPRLGCSHVRGGSVLPSQAALACLSFLISCSEDVKHLLWTQTLYYFICAIYCLNTHSTTTLNLTGASTWCPHLWELSQSSGLSLNYISFLSVK